MKFSDDQKKELGQFFGEGVHEVTIASVTADTTDDGKEFFLVDVEGANGEEGSARLWWTDKAAQFSFNTVKQIFVHNTPEAKRDAIRAEVDKADDTVDLLKLCQALKGKQCWYKVEKTNQTYVNANGETKNSYNRNIFGYKPKDVEKSGDILEDIANGTPVDVSEVPFE